jgi:hypothetical protein
MVVEPLSDGGGVKPVSKRYAAVPDLLQEAGGLLISAVMFLQKNQE